MLSVLYVHHQRTFTKPPQPGIHLTSDDPTSEGVDDNGGEESIHPERGSETKSILNRRALQAQ